MKIRQRRILLCLLILLVIGLMYGAIRNATQRRSIRKYIHMNDVILYGNETRARRRVPRIIHQTYRTHNIPSRWNRTVHSVIKRNSDQFEYYLWSDEEMNAFVRKHEFDFYQHTYTKYPYSIQRVDAFRYVLMFHRGGIYIDMDNGCNRAFKELVVTVESLDPDASHLAVFPVTEASDVDIDFIISTAGHPIFKQMISRLHLFNHYFLLPFWTVFLSTGPIFASIQEHFFEGSQKVAVRIMDADVYRPYFVWKENGGTWFTLDAGILFTIGSYKRFLFQSIIFLIIILVALKALLYYSRYRIQYRLYFSPFKQ